MQPHLINFEKKQFVSGLFWQIVPESGKLKDEVIKLADKLKQDIFVINKSSSVQVGFSSQIEGVSAGAYSLAMAVAKRVKDTDDPRNWMALFEIPGGKYCYIASRDGTFLPEGDIVSDIDQILEVMRTDYSIGDWDKIYISAGYAQLFQNAEIVTFETILPTKKGGKVDFDSKWKVEQVKKGLPWKIILSVVVVCLVGYLAYTQYVSYMQRIEDGDIQEKIAKARAMLSTQVVNAEVSKPWITTPTSASFMYACMSEFKLSLMSPGAWKLEEFNCTSTLAEYKWSRGLSNIVSLTSAIPSAIPDEAGNTASAQFPIADETETDNEPLLAKAEGINQFKSQFQRVAIPVDIRVSNKPIEGDQSKLTWVTYEFKYITQFIPTLGVIDLDMQGIRINKLTYRPGQVPTWEVAGNFYTSN